MAAAWRRSALGVVLRRRTRVAARMLSQLLGTGAPLRQVAAKLQVCYPSLCTRSAGIDALQVMVLELGLVCVVPETMLPWLRPVFLDRASWRGTELEGHLWGYSERPRGLLP